MAGRFSEEFVRRMHQAYLERHDLPPKQIAARFDVPPARMYLLFDREGLPRRAPETQAKPPKYLQFSRDQAVQMHHEYLESALPVDQFAAQFDLNSGTMYEIFSVHGLEERRVDRANGPTPPDERCSQFGFFIFCGHCPCEPPPCPQGREWDCEGTNRRVNPHPPCPHRPTCPCWQPSVRAAAEWSKAFSDWLHIEKRTARANGCSLRIKQWQDSLWDQA